MKKRKERINITFLSTIVCVLITKLRASHTLDRDKAIQGLLVAIFYCFLNEEVKTVLKKRFSRYHDARSLSTKYTKSSVMGYYGNTTTYGNTNGGRAGDQKRRLTGALGWNQPENIPLRITRDVEEAMN